MASPIRKVDAPPLRSPAEVAEWIASGGASSRIPQGYEPSRAVDPTSDPEVDVFHALEARRPAEPDKQPDPPAAQEARPAPAVTRDVRLLLLAFGKQDVADFGVARVVLTDPERKAVRQVLLRAYKRYQREVVARMEAE